MTRRELEIERNLIAVTFTDPGNPLREVDVLVAPSIDPDGIAARRVALVNEREEPGLFYEVSDEMLARFAQSTLAQRIQWLDEMRTFSWEMASPETRAAWRTARAAKRWDGR